MEMDQYTLHGDTTVLHLAFPEKLLEHILLRLLYFTDRINFWSKSE